MTLQTERFAKDTSNEPIRLLEVGCGAGDVALALQHTLNIKVLHVIRLQCGCKCVMLSNAGDCNRQIRNSHKQSQRKRCGVDARRSDGGDDSGDGVMVVMYCDGMCVVMR